MSPATPHPHREPVTVLGEVVCRAVIPEAAAPVAVQTTASMPDPRRAEHWKVTTEPRADGVEVRVHRLVPYPDDERGIVTPAYAGQVAEAIAQAVVAALAAARRDVAALCDQEGREREGLSPRR